MLSTVRRRAILLAIWLTAGVLPGRAPAGETAVKVEGPPVARRVAVVDLRWVIRQYTDVSPRWQALGSEAARVDLRETCPIFCGTMRDIREAHRLEELKRHFTDADAKTLLREQQTRSRQDGRRLRQEVHRRKRELLVRLFTVVEKYAATHGIDVILGDCSRSLTVEQRTERSLASRHLVVVYQNDLDISEAILAELKRSDGEEK